MLPWDFALLCAVMATLSPKTRFAPSPTGYLHLGNARVALFCYLFARRMQGVFLLRIEDTDLQRSLSNYTEALQEDLLWMGLGWQEGPGMDQGHGPYRQSQRGVIYEEYFTRLIAQAQAYPCFCSEQELALARKTQLAAGRPPRYSGVCSTLSAEQIDSKLAAGQRPTLRFRIPGAQTVEFTDLVRGVQRFNSDDIGDFIIRRADGTPAFFFTNALDDALMGVTHVLRGEDHLSNTPRQILLLQALGLRIPDYGHVSLILGPDGTPLSKRHGSHSVRELREAGYLPLAINNYLARLGHHYEGTAYRDMATLAADFDINKIGRAPARFDVTQLQHWQQEAVTHASVDELWAWMGEEVHAHVPAGQSEAFIDAVRANVTLPQHALHWARIIYADRLDLNEQAHHIVEQAGGIFFEHALQALEHHATDFKGLAGDLKKHTGTSGKALFQPLRAALTGELDGPEMVRLLPLLGLPRARARLQAALSHT